MIRLMIVDDQELLRKSLGHLIGFNDNLKVVDMLSNGREAVEACRHNPPDIILMDIEMPVLNGIAAMKQIKEIHKDVKVIILTTFDNNENIIEAFLAEADGYITKDITPTELISTIECVHSGLTVIHKSVKKVMVERFKKLSGSRNSYLDTLTTEEIDMVKAIVAGKSNKEVASLMMYTEGTIKNKVSKIYDKLGITDRLQLAVYAVENGID